MNKKNRYERLYQQVKEQIEKSDDLIAKMASVVAIFHHKMPYFFWTGFYRLIKGELIVGPYQGPVACIRLEKNKGVCWAGVNKQESIIVPDVDKFPGHIACDSRSKSEIVVPLKNKNGEVIGVLDVDSKELNAFDPDDARGLEKIMKLLQK
ncbi:MAG: GAF domain-containing protein [Bacteroidales bacterium]|nr:GAF domain-containing protein [Bacteroidales bacterium]MCF8350347.1 GAF domain-containing protein [Bacteroidales bacterium]MCF8376479.1 GAF domain-containing protein [Bacteroidales bacterium]